MDYTRSAVNDIPELFVRSASTPRSKYYIRHPIPSRRLGQSHSEQFAALNSFKHVQGDSLRKGRGSSFVKSRDPALLYPTSSFCFLAGNSTSTAMMTL